MEPSPAQRAARDRIAAQLAQAGFALPGTLTVRAYACGKPGCRCHADPPRLHGPYAEWTRKIGGKTITRRLTPRQLAEYQPLFDNAKKLRTLLSDLQDLTLQIIETGSTREPSTPPEPEPPAPENVGETRLTCGQPSSQTPFAQVSSKREDHTSFGLVSGALTSVNADSALQCLRPSSDHDCPCVTVVGRSLSHVDRTPCLRALGSLSTRRRLSGNKPTRTLQGMARVRSGRTRTLSGPSPALSPVSSSP